MNEIRVVWSLVGRRSIADEPIQGGLWPPDTPENRETLTIRDGVGQRVLWSRLSLD
jgi:hypothetical protein